MTENVRGKLPRTTGWQPVLPESRAPSSAFTMQRSRSSLLFCDDKRGQIGLLDHFAYFRQIFILELRPFFQLLIELAAQCLKHVQLRFCRLTIACLISVAKRFKSLV